MTNTDLAMIVRQQALPCLRRTSQDMLRCVSIGNDPATISGADWRDISDDLETILALEATVGRPDDGYGAMLDTVLDAAPWRVHL